MNKGQMSKMGPQIKLGQMDRCCLKTQALK